MQPSIKRNVHTKLSKKHLLISKQKEHKHLTCHSRAFPFCEINYSFKSHVKVWICWCHKIRKSTLVFEQIDFIIIIFTLHVVIILKVGYSSSLIRIWVKQQKTCLQKTRIEYSIEDWWINWDSILLSSFYNIHHKTNAQDFISKGSYQL